MDQIDPTPAAWLIDLRVRMDQLLDVYRDSLQHCMDGLTESEVRLRLVPSQTTLLGLVKHVTYVEGVWFDQAITGQTTADIGIASSPAESFRLRASDSVASVQLAHQERCHQSRRTMAELELDTVVDGRGQNAVWALLLQVLRELAQHAGHADILREQILAARTGQEATDPTTTR